MSIDLFPQKLPTLQRLGVGEPTTSSATAAAIKWFNAFASAIAAADIPGIVTLFLEDGYWKDILALTWDFRTFEGRDAIRNLLEHDLLSAGLVDLHLSHEPLQAPSLQRPLPDLVFVRLTFEFGTRVGSGTAVCHLVPAPGPTWKAYTLFTCLHSLQNFPEQVGPLRPRVAEHGTWEERRRRELEFTDGDPAVIVIGAGHTGLEVAARLKYLGVSHLVVDKNARVGDSWRGRYKALCLHDTVWSNQTPYLQFPPTWPVFSPASKLADWLEGYARYLELNVWTSSVITKTAWDNNLKIWTVEINRGGKETRIFKAKHLVFATGLAYRPKLPDIPGKVNFKGEVIHSAEFTSASNHLGKKAIVVGACNSGHDIAQDFLNNGVDVTMYQRSSTYVASPASEAISNIFSCMLFRPDLRTVIVYDLQALYNDSVPTELADLYRSSLPRAVSSRIRQCTVARVAQTIDKDTLDGLAKVGFRTNLGLDGTGSLDLVFTRGGGFYINTGTSKHIIDGAIKLKSGSTIERFTEKGLQFADGTELEADIIVFATGYGDPRDSMRNICGPQVADKVRPVWGLTTEGELSGAWRDCGHDGLWFALGNLSMSRFYSRHLALQIKALETGILKRSEVKP